MFFFILSCLGPLCVFCSLNSVIGLGVGAGAYVLARFAVSLKLFRFNKILRWFSCTEYLKNE